MVKTDIEKFEERLPGKTKQINKLEKRENQTPNSKQIILPKPWNVEQFEDQNLRRTARGHPFEPHIAKDIINEQLKKPRHALKSEGTSGSVFCPPKYNETLLSEAIRQ